MGTRSASKLALVVLTGTQAGEKPTVRTMPYRPGVLRRHQIDAARWLVLVKDDANNRFMVGVVGRNGEITDDAIHARQDLADLDFEARSRLHPEAT
jgi:hypothetical protein